MTQLLYVNSDTEAKGGPRPARWLRCDNPACRAVHYAPQRHDNLDVCPACSHHHRLSARQRIHLLVDPASFRELDAELTPADPLGFVAAGHAYAAKLIETQRRTGLREAALAGSATIAGYPLELVALDFAFFGASMGGVVGEKIARAADRARRQRVPLVTISTSGGARMHEGIFALLQMANTVAALGSLGELGVPHISILTDPTLGGVTASYAGLGDVIIAEQGALVGFAGPRVIEQITKQKLPPEAQRAAFLLEHGMVDRVTGRHELRPLLERLLRLFAQRGTQFFKVDSAAPGDARMETPAEGGERLDAWARVQLARHPARPHTLDYIERIFTDFVELHGDRTFADDPALVGGLASLEGRTVMVLGQQKGRDTRDNVLRRFGMARPEGYRKALRLLRLAEKLGVPVITLIDIPGADPSLAAEERGQAFAIADNLLALSRLQVPVVAAIIGEGGSGGALALGLADRVLMCENAIYSVASPEAAASILWKDGARAPEAAAAMRITAPDLRRFGVVDAVVPEPAAGAHTDYDAAAQALRAALLEQLGQLERIPPATLAALRAERFRAINRRLWPQAAARYPLLVDAASAN